MKDNAVYGPPILQRHLIEIIGETVEYKDNRERRIAAKEIVKRGVMLGFPQDRQDLVMAEVEIFDLSYHLADAPTYFAAELAAETEPYSTEGILFHALVDLVRIEEGMSLWNWVPEQLRALGLAIHLGEEVAWPITRDFVTIKNREGTCRRFYRLSS